jgi:chromate transporter
VAGDVGGELGRLARTFLALGSLGFGGPAAHIAMMEEWVVSRHRWMTREEFLELVGVVNLLPGPNSTELAIHVGYRRAGIPGLLVAGLAFILPATLIVLACAWAYVRYGDVPAVRAVWSGVQPVVVAIVATALVRFARAGLITVQLRLLAMLSLALAAVGTNEFLVLLVSGALAIVPTRSAALVVPWLLPLGLVAAAPAGSLSIFAYFLRVGAVLYGSGYVLLAFLHRGLVERAGWLTESQLLDAVVVGQATPGPVFTTATFVGYLLGGVPGALAATLGIFLPAFVFVAASGPLIRWVRRVHRVRAFLDGVTVASLALMALVTWELGRTALDGALPLLIALGSALLLRAGVNSAVLVLAGAGLGLVL